MHPYPQGHFQRLGRCLFFQPARCGAGFNKYKRGSIEKDLIKRLLREYQVIGFLPFDGEIERVFIDALPEIPRGMKDEFVYMSQDLGFTRKMKMVDGLFLNRRKL